MSTRSKALFAGIVGVVIPAALALCAVAAVIGYAHQHVHDRTAKILNDHQAIVRVHDFNHSTADVLAVASAITIVWALIAGLLILAGGAMYAARDRKWD